MNYRTLGRTGLTVSEIGLGTLAIGGPFILGNVHLGRGKVADKDSEKMLNVALDAGVNFIDTADIYGYGKAEEIIGKVISRKREKVIVSTKGGNRGDEKKWSKDFSPSWIKNGCENSLKRLQTDYIDVYMLHTPDVDFEFNESAFDALNDLKKEGKIRFYGCSVATIQQGIDFINSEFGDVVEACYNISERDAINELFPLAEHRDMGVVIKSPLMSGLLTGKYDKNSIFDKSDFRKLLYQRKYLTEAINIVDFLKPIAQEFRLTLSQLALKYCLNRQEVSTVIPGAKTAGQILENSRASDGKDLPVTVLERIERELIQV
jgi:aryl-alcohol dehydrogenase-like predicted oxidoreductase